MIIGLVNRKGKEGRSITVQLPNPSRGNQSPEELASCWGRWKEGGKKEAKEEDRLPIRGGITQEKEMEPSADQGPNWV